MKKTISAVVAVLIAGIFSVNAQTTGDVTVNINLHKFQTLTVNGGDVDINFTDEAHYESGASSGMIDNHLTVSSTNAFVVTATAVTANMNSVTSKMLGDAAVPLYITAQNGSTNPLTSATYANDQLLTTGTEVVSSTEGQFGKNISVQYDANKGDFINMGLINGEFVSEDNAITTYTVNVTYTISVN